MVFLANANSAAVVNKKAFWQRKICAAIGKRRTPPAAQKLHRHRMLPISVRICPYIACLRYFGAILCVIYSSSVYVQDYLFPLSFVFQTWIFLLCYFSCGRQTCFDCSTGGLSFPTHRLSLFYSTGIARGCLFSTMRNAPGHWPGACLFIPIYNMFAMSYFV